MMAFTRGHLENDNAKIHHNSRDNFVQLNKIKALEELMVTQINGYAQFAAS